MEENFLITSSSLLHIFKLLSLLIELELQQAHNIKWKLKCLLELFSNDFLRNITTT